MRITLLIEPSRHRAIPFAAGPERYQRLADELSRYARVQVPIVTDRLQNAPDDAYVLFAGGEDLSRSLANCGRERASRLAARIVLLDVSWQKALEQLEEHRLAGAVDSLRLSEWLARPSSSTGPFGRKYLAKPLGASCVSMPSSCSPHYCLLQSEHHRGMPHLLAEYLAVYDRDQKSLSAEPVISVARVVFTPVKKTQENLQTMAGPQERATAISQVESVSIKRAIASLKQARESAHITLPQVAERAGLDAEQFSLLERGDYLNATFGTLRAYFFALGPTWEWTLADTTKTPFQRPQSGMETGETSTQPTLETPIGPEIRIAPLFAKSSIPPEVRGVLLERGMMVSEYRCPRRKVTGELDNPNSQTLKEGFYAGV